jgi:hypothetical protein
MLPENHNPKNAGVGEGPRSKPAIAAAGPFDSAGHAVAGSPFARNACMKISGVCRAITSPGNARIVVA